MTPAQTRMYFREWAKVRSYFVAKGIDPAQADSKRHELHKRALGAMKSSKDFTNEELDKVLAVFYSFTRPGDLDAQMRLQEQPARRIGKLQAQCWDLVRRLPKIKAALDPQFYAENYLDSMARSIAGVVFEQLGETQLARLLGILRHRLCDQAPAEPVSPASNQDDVPF